MFLDLRFYSTINKSSEISNSLYNHVTFLDFFRRLSLLHLVHIVFALEIVLQCSVMFYEFLPVFDCPCARA